MVSTIQILEVLSTAAGMVGSTIQILEVLSTAAEMVGSTIQILEVLSTAAGMVGSTVSVSGMYSLQYVHYYMCWGIVVHTTFSTDFG